MFNLHLESRLGRLGETLIPWKLDAMKNSVIEVLTRRTVLATQLVLITLSVLAVWIFNEFDVSGAVVSDDTTVSIQLNRYEFFLVLILLFLNVATAYALFRKFNHLNRIIKYSTGLMIATFLLLTIWLGRMLIVDAFMSGTETVATAVGRVELLLVMMLVLGSIMATTFLFRRFQRVEPYVVMSAYSKKIQYKGEWITIEEYFKRELGLVVSHGITPDEKDAALAEFNRQMADASREKKEQEAQRPKAPPNLTPKNENA